MTKQLTRVKSTSRQRTNDPSTLAALAHNKCTSLVGSCYVAARSSDTKEEESKRFRANPKNREKNTASTTSTKIEVLEVVEGFMDGNKINLSNKVSKIKKSDMCNQSKTRGTHVAKGISQVESSINYGPHPIKSNLKKNTMIVEMNSQLSRKVSWSDAHGKDIAHVQEFEPSEEGEIGSVGKSCRCAIQ